jgi:hypothetical protein
MSLVGRVSSDMEDVVDVRRGEADAIMGWAVFRTVRDGVSAMVLSQEIEEYETVTRGKRGDEDVKWLGVGLWVSALWRGERWGEEMGRRGMEDVGKVFEGSRRELGDDVEDRAVEELGDCLGVKCWLGDHFESPEEKTMLEMAESNIQLWEGRLDELEDGEAKGVAAVMTSAALLPGGEYRHGIST